MGCGVIRRVGGLEGRGHAARGLRRVIRRVGGLEAAVGKRALRDAVIRRVGGLEDRAHLVLAYATLSAV